MESTKAKETMVLVRLLYYSAAKHNINVCIAHIVGAKNNIAGCLSHFQQVIFKKLASQANPVPDSIPAWLMQPSLMPHAVPPSWNSVGLTNQDSMPLILFITSLEFYHFQHHL